MDEKDELFKMMAGMITDVQNLTVHMIFKMVSAVIKEALDYEVKVNENTSRKLYPDEKLLFISKTLDNLANEIYQEAEKLKNEKKK